MKRKLLIILLALFFTSIMVGCGESENDIFVENGSNVYSTDCWIISAFNDYKCIDYKIVKDEDSGNYTVTFEFKKFGVTLCR